MRERHRRSRLEEQRLDAADPRFAIGHQLVHAGVAGRGELLRPDVDGDRQRRRVAPDLLAPGTDHRQRLAELAGLHSVEVQLVGETSGQPPGHVRPVATNHDWDARLLDRLRHVDRVADVCVGALERRVRRPCRLQHPRDDLQVVGEPGEALLRLGEAVAVGEPLVALPAGADAQLHPASADRIHRGDHLRRQGRVPEPRTDHDVPQPDPRRQRGERRERRERFEGDLVGRARHRVEMVEEPDGLEPERLGLLGDLHGPVPRGERLPAVVLAHPALRRDDPDLHDSSNPFSCCRATLSRQLDVGRADTSNAALRSLIWRYDCNP